MDRNFTKKHEEELHRAQRRNQESKKAEDTNRESELLRLRKGTHETTVKTMSNKPDHKTEKNQDRDKVVINGDAIVVDYYRNVNQARRDLQNERNESKAMKRYKKSAEKINKKSNTFEKNEAKTIGTRER